MSFRLLVAVGVVLVIAADVLFLPGILHGINDNPQTEHMLKHPDDIYNFFSTCKKEVLDADRCYYAYSASVQIANSPDCTPSGIELKRKFKKLVEHARDLDIESEIKIECQAHK
ncbi:hypothetical protein [Enterobacter asburiae]